LNAYLIHERNEIFSLIFAETQHRPSIAESIAMTNTRLDLVSGLGYLHRPLAYRSLMDGAVIRTQHETAADLHFYRQPLLPVDIPRMEGDTVTSISQSTIFRRNFIVSNIYRMPYNTAHYRSAVALRNTSSSSSTQPSTSSSSADNVSTTQDRGSSNIPSDQSDHEDDAGDV